MKKYSELDVDLVNLDTFEFYPGGEQFSEEYSDYAISRLRFRFDDISKLEEAKQRLSDLKLKFKHFFGILLESDSELEQYPIVIITFNTQYNILKYDGNIPFVQENAASSQFNKDLQSGTLIVSQEAKLFLENECPALKFEHLFGVPKKKEYYQLLNLKALSNSRTLQDEDEIQELTINGDTFYQPVELSGKIMFSNKTLNEIKEGRFMVMDTFSYKGKIYKTPKNVFVASGEFALKLQDKFNFEKENISLVIPTLNHF